MWSELRLLLPATAPPPLQPPVEMPLALILHRLPAAARPRLHRPPAVRALCEGCQPTHAALPSPSALLRSLQNCRELEAGLWRSGALSTPQRTGRKVWEGQGRDAAAVPEAAWIHSIDQAV